MCDGNWWNQPFYLELIVLYMNDSSHCLHMLDSVHHGALRFITNYLLHTTLYYIQKWIGLQINSWQYPYLFIFSFKLAIWEIQSLFSWYIKIYCYQSPTELGKKAFRWSAPMNWTTYALISNYSNIYQNISKYSNLERCQNYAKYIESWCLCANV